jgi:transcriptional regulator with XRE-family HTH domain
METVDEKVQQALAALIKGLRRGRGLSQLELADKIGKTKQAVSCYERGVYSPTIGVLIQIAEACGTTLSDIFNSLSSHLGIQVSDIEAERALLERELQMGHDALDRAGAPRDGEDTVLPFSVPERVRHLAAAMQAIERERDVAQRDIAAAQDDMTTAGVKLEPGMTLTDRVRSLIRSKISSEDRLYILRLSGKGIDLGYDVAIERELTTKSVNEATRRSLAESQTRAGLLKFGGFNVQILKVEG